jgi:hypothetical protein
MTDEEWNGLLNSAHRQMIKFLRSYVGAGTVGSKTKIGIFKDW